MNENVPLGKAMGPVLQAVILYLLVLLKLRLYHVYSPPA